MKIQKSLVAAILLLITVLFFISLFFLSNSLQNYGQNFTKDNASKNTLNSTNNTEKTIRNKERCLELGCPEDSIYVGSVNSNKYYYCTCHYAERIYEENILCFKTKQEAQQKNYSYIDC